MKAATNAASAIATARRDAQKISELEGAARRDAQKISDLEHQMQQLREQMAQLQPLLQMAARQQQPAPAELRQLAQPRPWRLNIS